MVLEVPVQEQVTPYFELLASIGVHPWVVAVAHIRTDRAQARKYNRDGNEMGSHNPFRAMNQKT